MTRTEIWRYCGNIYVGDGSGNGESYGLRMDRPWSFLTCTRGLLTQLQTDREREKFPRGTRFVPVTLGEKQHLVLRLRFEDAYRFAWRLNKRLTARENGFANSRRRFGALAEQAQYHTAADLLELWRIQVGRCYYTGLILGRNFRTASYHVEHLAPISEGGHDGPLNLALVSPKTNASKGNRSRRWFLQKLQPSATQLTEIRRIDLERRRLFRLVDRLKANRTGRGSSSPAHR